MKLKLITYKKDLFRKQLKVILEAIGIKWKWFGLRVYYKGKRQKCKSCKSKLTLWSIGHIAPGEGNPPKPILYCDDSLCNIVFVTDYEDD